MLPTGSRRWGPASSARAGTKRGDAGSDRRPSAPTSAANRRSARCTRREVIVVRFCSWGSPRKLGHDRFDLSRAEASRSTSTPSQSSPRGVPAPSGWGVATYEPCLRSERRPGFSAMAWYVRGPSGFTLADWRRLADRVPVLRSKRARLESHVEVPRRGPRGEQGSAGGAGGVNPVSGWRDRELRRCREPEVAGHHQTRVAHGPASHGAACEPLRTRDLR